MSLSEQPLVSIAIPTYNRANSYLKGAIECALTQSYQNLEILISDNCSTDNTEDVVKSFDDTRIRYVKQEINLGPNGNFNYCINEAKGDFLLLLLDDDRIDQDFVETCINATKGNFDIGLIRTGTRMIDENDNVTFERQNTAKDLSNKDFFLAWFNNEITLFVCSTLFNTRHLREIGGFQSKHHLFQDVMAESKLIIRFGRVDIKESKASFRWHADNWGGKKILAWCEDSMDLLDIICDLLPKDKIELREKGLAFFCRMIYNFALSLPSGFERVSKYLTIAKTFEHAESPVKFYLKKDLRPKLRSIKRKFIPAASVKP